ncbi:hypothetical protein P7K49_021104, partial [Saguinus oedipus]
MTLPLRFPWKPNWDKRNKRLLKVSGAKDIRDRDRDSKSTQRTAIDRCFLPPITTAQGFVTLEHLGPAPQTLHVSSWGREAWASREVQALLAPGCLLAQAQPVSASRATCCLCWDECKAPATFPSSEPTSFRVSHLHYWPREMTSWSKGLMLRGPSGQ